jgi:hypothetical protein
VIEVIDLTCDDDGDNEGDDGNPYRGKLAQIHSTGSTSRDANFTLLDIPFPGRRPTPFTPHRPLCQAHWHTQPTILQHHLQRPHLARRNTLGRMSLSGPHCTVNFNSVLISLLITRALMRCTPAQTALDPPQPSSSLRRGTLGIP